MPACPYLHKILCCLSFFVSSVLCSQKPHPAFKSYDGSDGLISSKVYSVQQDSKGYIWFATNNGVSRFNGYEFENFSQADGLPDNTVFNIYEDHRGRIWFLPLSNQLSYFENGKIHPYKYNDLIKAEFKTSLVKTSFFVDRKGTIHLGLNGWGYFQISEHGTFRSEKAKPGNTHHGAIFEPEKGHFIHTNDQICSRRKIRVKTALFSGEIDPDFSYDIKSAVMAVTTMDSTRLAVSINNMLMVIDKGGVRESVDFNYRIIFLYIDRGGDLWVGTYLGGVYHIRNNDFKNKACYLKGFSVTGVLNDGENGFWITTEGNAVYYTPSKDVLTYDVSSGLIDNRVSALVASRTVLYAGIQAGYIQELDTTGQIVRTRMIDLVRKERDITALGYQEEKDRLWYSGSRGVGFINNKGVAFSRKEGLFSDIVFDPDGKHFWMATMGAISCYSELQNGKIKGVHKPFKRMNAILRKNKNTLYVGAIDGLWEFGIADTSFTYIGKKAPLLQERVLDLAYTKDSVLLIATKGAGLLIYDAGKLQQLNVSSGLNSNIVFRLLVEDSTVWVATDKGLNSFVIRRGKPVKNTIRHFSALDGLVSGEINDVLKFGNRIWIATDKGISVFDPGSIGAASGEMPVYIGSIFINDSSRAVMANYGLKYSENNIRIRFIALSYKKAGKLQYRYKMKGLNSDWNYTQEREIQYTTLPPGRYTFILSVLNASGTWSREITVSFDIAVPFWKTWWFIGFSLVLAIITLYYGISYWISRKHKLKNKEEQISRVLIELKLKALRAQMNPHFVFNVMTSIQHFILHNDDDAAHRYLSKFSKLIRAILSNSEKNMIPLVEEIKALSLYLELEDMRFEKHFESVIYIAPSIDVNTVQIPSMLIQPYVENAIKHGILRSVNKGKIRISIDRYHTLLKCTIEDNGVGRHFTLENRSSDYRSFGTSITKERLAAINKLYNNRLSEKVIDLYDEQGKPAGTKIEIYMPYE